MYGANGGLGKHFYTKQWKGETVLCLRPAKRPGPGTPAQEKARRMMTYADNYARKALADPKIAHFYQEKATKGKLNPHNLAVRDFCKKPQVTDLWIDNYSGKPGDEIIIETRDDFRVSGLRIAIYNASDVLVEEGWANEVCGWMRWNYIATQPSFPKKGSRIIATAYDLAGNSTSLEAICN